MRWDRIFWGAVLLSAGLGSSLAAQSQLDKLLREAQTAPASQPTTRPASQPADDAEKPVASAIVAEGAIPGRPDALPGKIELSTGQTLVGRIYTTRDAPFRIYVREKQAFVDVPPAAVARLDAIIEWEKMEDDWRFLEGGSDVKIKTGRQYPARKTTYKITLLDGSTLTGDLKAPLWVQGGKGDVRQVVLYQRNKGELGQTLSDVTYVKSVVFDPPASQPAGK